MKNGKETPTFDKQKFASRLKKRIKEKNLTRKDLAKALNYSEDTVHTWCSSAKKSMPSPENIISLCEILDCDFDYLVGNIDAYSHTVQDVCNITGLHPDTVEKIIKMRKYSEQFDQDKAPYKHFIDYVLTDDNLLDAINRYCFACQTEQFEITIPTFDEAINNKPVPEGYTLVNDKFEESPSDVHRVKTTQPVIANGYRIDTLMEEAAFKILHKCLDSLSETLKKEYQGNISKIDKRYL